MMMELFHEIELVNKRSHAAQFAFFFQLSQVVCLNIDNIYYPIYGLKKWPCMPSKKIIIMIMVHAVVPAIVVTMQK